MTIQDAIKEELVANGLFPEDADKVLELLKADEYQKAMKSKWQDNIEGYPAEFKTAIWLVAKRCTLTWIDENIPLAWYRPQFE